VLLFAGFDYGFALDLDVLSIVLVAIVRVRLLVLWVYCGLV